MNGYIATQEGKCGGCGRWIVLRKDSQVRAHGMMKRLSHVDGGDERAITPDCAFASAPVEIRPRARKARTRAAD